MTHPLKTVAIIEDDNVTVRALELMLAQFGYQVVGTAPNGPDGVDMVRKTAPNVVLVDLHIPLMDGLEVTRQLSVQHASAVVLMTGDTNPNIALQAMDLGASAYLQKPFDHTQIAAILESAWHGFQTVLALREKNRILDEALEIRKLTEKAKGILMDQQGFSEDEAHKCLLKMSQDQGITLKEVCRSIIQVRMVLGKKGKRVA